MRRDHPFKKRQQKEKWGWGLEATVNMELDKIWKGGGVGNIGGLYKIGG